MNAPKAFTIKEAEDETPFWEAEYIVYSKSEADRYIAHLKCKRCEAMAKWCERKRIDSANYRIPREKWQFYDKWNQRWLELAEKFKEGV